MMNFIEIPYHGQSLRGMHHGPDKPTSGSPTVIMYHGFTGTHIEGHRLFYHISVALQRVGVSSVRCDFLGSGDSDGDYADMTLTSLLEQAKHIVSYAHERLDAGPIYLLGFSQGGLVASLIAEQSPSVPKVVLISPGRARRMLERDKHLYADESKTVIDINGNRVGRAYYLGLPEYLNRPERFHDNQDILIVHGTNDQATPVEFSQDYLNTPGGRKRLVTVSGADHGYSSFAWQDTLVDEVVKFLG